jgi:hypothetical protein
VVFVLQFLCSFSQRPETDRIDDLLTAVDNEKVSKRYYEYLIRPTTRDKLGNKLTATTITYADAECFIRSTALSLEELDKMLSTKQSARKTVRSCATKAQVTETVFSKQYEKNKTTPTGRLGYLTKCEVCHKNHETKDCARWLAEQGVCITWYLNDIGVRKEVSCTRDPCPYTHKLPSYAPTQDSIKAAKVYSDAKDAATAENAERDTAKVASVQGTVPSDDESSDEDYTKDPHRMKDPKDCKKTAAARRASAAAVRNRICLPVKVCTRPYTECTKQESA